jgi:5-methylcytosine-specific restriction endonuclease McrA
MWEHMFVSDLRSTVADLLDAGLNMNEIAHRLGVARSTVGYHAEILRTQKQDAKDQVRHPPKRRQPVAAPGVKQRLFKAGIKTRRCESCGLTKWNGGVIPLALHHANGNRNDNRLENLQILCANCHGQTDTWAGRNNRRTRLAAQSCDAA